MRPPRPLHLDDLPAGPEPGTLLCRTDALPDHGGAEIIFRDGDQVAHLLVQRYNGQVYLYENRCPHAGTPLNLFDERFLNTDGSSLICRTHGAQFHVETGYCHLGPCKGQYLRAVAFEERDGGLYSV
ncbi:MAG: Rieske (2Fe-2S) protein [Alphaproteobacteria bacterium]|nr:MAG: Rieske (2Fe-2S) protein [Alphaproteobacteria bacterium]